MLMLLKKITIGRKNLVAGTIPCFSLSWAGKKVLEQNPRNKKIVKYFGESIFPLSHSFGNSRYVLSILQGYNLKKQ